MSRVLIVDDSLTDVHAIKTILEGGGYEVEVADSAAEGLEMAQEHKPDLVLMDLVFEGMNGFQCTRKLARGSETSHIPVIIVSRKDQESDKIWGRRQGAVAYLVKPVDPGDLLSTVGSVLRARGPARAS